MLFRSRVQEEGRTLHCRWPAAGTASELWVKDHEVCAFACEPGGVCVSVSVLRVYACLWLHVSVCVHVSLCVCMSL